MNNEESPKRSLEIPFKKLNKRQGMRRGGKGLHMKDSYLQVLMKFPHSGEDANYV